MRYWFVGWKDWRLVCAARGHRQEIGYGTPEKRGGDQVIAAGPVIALWKSGPEAYRNLAGTSCRCGRRERSGLGSS
jgi:hypothetical protein